MAADSLQDNHYSPSFLTQGLLKRIRQKLAKINEDKLRKIDKGSHQGKRDSSNPVQPEALRDTHQPHNNDNKESGTSFDIQDDSSNNSIDIMTEIAVDNGCKRPQLTTYLSNGFVRIPKLPRNLRSANSSSLAPPSTNATESAKDKCEIHHKEKNLASDIQKQNSTEKVFSRKSNDQTTLQELLLRSSFTLDQSDCKEVATSLQAEEHIHTNNEACQQKLEETNHATSKTLLPEGHLLPSFSSLSIESCTGDLSYSERTLMPDISSGHNTPKLLNETNGQDFIFFNLNSLTTNEDLIMSSSKEEYEFNQENSEICSDYPQAHSDRMCDMTATTDTSKVKASSSNQAIQSICEEMLEPHPEVLCESQKGSHTQNDTAIKSEKNPKKIAENKMKDQVKEKDQIDYNKSFSKRKQFINILHLLFDLQLRRNYRDDDMEPLVEEILEDIPRIDETEKKKDKKKWNCDLSLTGYLGKSETTMHSSSSLTVKKRRWPKKKTVYQAGNCLKKNLGRGCRSLSYGFSYLVTEIPESSPPKGAGTRSDGSSCSVYSEDGISNHSEATLPLQSSRKKRFMALELF